MNAVEKLQAAIDKLEAFKSELELGTLTVTRFEDGRNEDVWVDNVYKGDSYTTYDTPMVFDRSQGPRRFRTAEYVVTLHRTIDAQLAILRTAKHYVEQSMRHGFVEEQAVALADAILGEEQG